MSEHHGDRFTRRGVLTGAASGLALAAMESQRAQAQSAPGARVSGQVSGQGSAQVSGIVFEDRDGSGVASANPGLAGVLVSNGRDVAVTGGDGRYTLPLPDEATIFVIKPAGFTPPVERQTNLPRSIAITIPKARPPLSTCASRAWRQRDRSRRRSISRFAARMSAMRSTS